MQLLTNRTCCAGERSRLIASLVPATALLLIPKCPLCVAAYVATISGLGISVSAASNLRIATIVACVGAVLFLTAGLIRRGH